MGSYECLRIIGDVGDYEVGARVLMLIVAFVPFFAFAEIARVVGPGRLATMFFSKRVAPGDALRSAA